MLKNFLSILAGLGVAMVTMLVCEYINSLFFPLPENLDVMNAEAVRNFTDTLPWYAFVLVLAGWILGSFFGGMTVRKIAKEGVASLVIVTLLLTFFALINIWMLEHPLWVIIVGLPQFTLMTWLGWRVASPH